jgi:hypothetical protein
MYFFTAAKKKGFSNFIRELKCFEDAANHLAYATQTTFTMSLDMLVNTFKIISRRRNKVLEAPGYWFALQSI